MTTPLPTISSNVTSAHRRLVRTASDRADARSFAALTGRAAAAFAAIIAAAPVDGAGALLGVDTLVEPRVGDAPAACGVLDVEVLGAADAEGPEVTSGVGTAVVTHNLPKSTPSGPTPRSSVTAIPATWRLRQGSGGDDGGSAPAGGAAKTNSSPATASTLTSGVPARTGRRRAPPPLPR